MAAGKGVLEEDRMPLYMDDTNQVEHVSEFPYLSSVIESSGRMDADIERRTAQTSKAFSHLRRPVFLDREPTVQTKRKISQACVLSVLLYSSECWRHRRKLDAFHHRCVRTLLGISTMQQWAHRYKSREIR